MSCHRRRRGFLCMDLDDFEDYLADKPEHERWELIGGRVVKAMVGARWEHHFIIRNLAHALETHLRATRPSCQVFTETFWLKQRFMKLAVFPDVMVRRGSLEPNKTAVDDPLILVEVVSPGSEERDRNEKRELYKRLPTLKHCVLIVRDRASIEVIDRGTSNDWSPPRTIEGLGSTLDLSAIAFGIPLSEVYLNVIEG